MLEALALTITLALCDPPTWVPECDEVGMGRGSGGKG